MILTGHFHHCCNCALLFGYALTCLKKKKSTAGQVLHQSNINTLKKEHWHKEGVSRKKREFDQNAWVNNMRGKSIWLDITKRGTGTPSSNHPKQEHLQNGSSKGAFKVTLKLLMASHLWAHFLLDIHDVKHSNTSIVLVLPFWLETVF